MKSGGVRQEKGGRAQDRIEGEAGVALLENDGSTSNRR